jgi:hypothetical protein
MYAITCCANISSLPAANTGSLDVQLWIHAPLCAGRAARRPRRAARSFWRSGQAKDHADIHATDMRISCGHVVRGVSTHLKLLLAARGPPKTSSEPRRGRDIVFRNSRISLSAGRRACEPAAKPAIPGVILVHYGLLWPERTPRCFCSCCCGWCASASYKHYQLPTTTKDQSALGA